MWLQEEEPSANRLRCEECVLGGFTDNCENAVVAGAVEAAQPTICSCSSPGDT